MHETITFLPATSPYIHRFFDDDYDDDDELTPAKLTPEREKFIHHKQINDVTIKIINLCGRLPGRKFPSSWPPMLIQIILFYITQRNQTIKPNQSNILELI